MNKVVALAGGVGGAKLVFGLSKILTPDKFTAIINTGDDFKHLGLKICPDIDSFCYSRAGISDQKHGWGQKNESWNCLTELKKLGSETWFQLGDKDLALQLERARLLSSGLKLTKVTRSLCKKLGIEANVIPMTDDNVSTIIHTEEYGEISFQEYFVKYKFIPRLINYRFDGISNARMTPESKKAIEEADLVVICPSNPWLSINPILEIENTKELIQQKTVVAVSPIVGNIAIKGPAAKIFLEMGIQPSAFEVARLYQSIIKGFVLDNKNKNETDTISSWGIIPFVTDTMMNDDRSKIRLATEIYSFAKKTLRT
jgi:LPPG:FO 2-phospho-L-lactate transferase